ncbi:hypothetical protein E2C01_069777 [Portunus trituberculatus]|uniref:Uncharacterized protein n=1 Tax=Portunus trituberculatus TaxID=210409 RepID=A0A5B7HSF9_PORTR|nr:hypothetical protein [Portunus trituberculatus]
MLVVGGHKKYWKRKEGREVKENERRSRDWRDGGKKRVRSGEEGKGGAGHERRKEKREEDGSKTGGGGGGGGGGRKADEAGR